MSLYNEVRPAYLDEVKGQVNVVKQIYSIIMSNKIPNVSLFVGPRGTGKTTVARIFAKSINCKNPTEKGHCNSCESCRAIADNNSFDVVELDAASHNKVDDVHALIEATQYAPLGKYKVYIIDEVHMLSTAAFNALLKLLEEPPAYCRFILCTTEEHKVPVTILSRCRKFYFEKIDLAVVAEKLAFICNSRHISFEPDALRIIAKRSEGCMRDAESLLEIFIDSGAITLKDVSTILGTADEETVFGILSSIVLGNAASAIQLLRECSCRGKNLQGVLKALIEALSDSVYYLQTSDFSLVDNSDAYKQQLAKFASSTTVEKCLELIHGLTAVVPAMQKSNDVSFILETQLLALIQNESEIVQLRGRIAKLEQECADTTSALYDAISELMNADSNGTIRNVSQNNAAAEVAERISETSHEASVTTYTTTEATIAEEEKVPASNIETVPVTVKEEFFTLPSFATDLPGDISIPEGTQIMGTISLFNDVDSESAIPNENIELLASVNEDELRGPLSNSVSEESQEDCSSFERIAFDNVNEIPFDVDVANTSNDTCHNEPETQSDTTESSDVRDINDELYDTDLFSGFADLGDLPIIQTICRSAKSN